MRKVLFLLAIGIVATAIYYYHSVGGSVNWLQNVHRRVPVTDLKDYKPGSLTK